MHNWRGFEAVCVDNRTKNVGYITLPKTSIRLPVIVQILPGIVTSLPLPPLFPSIPA